MDGPFPPEVWVLLAKQALTKSILRNLCLTSKTLKDIFTPVLYRNINLSNRHLPPAERLEMLSLLDVESHLRYTRRFEAGYVSPKEELLFMSKCLEKMTNLDSCQINVSFPPYDDALYQIGNDHKLTDIFARHVERKLSFNDSDHPDELDEQWPFISSYMAFKNLRQLDLRNLTGDLPDLCLDIAEVLIESPNLKVLGLEINYVYWEAMDKTRYLHIDFLRSVITYFQQLAEERGQPGTKLAIENLMLGLGVYDTASDVSEGDFDCLSNITDLSKLQTLQLLNKRTARQPEWWDNYLDLNPKVFRAATNLRMLSVDVLSKGVVELVDALLGISGKFREIEIKLLGDKLDSPQRWFPPRLEFLGGCWHKILIGIDPYERCDDSDITDSFDLFRHSKDLEEMALPYISWAFFDPFFRKALEHYCNLHTCMFGYLKRMQIIGSQEEPDELAEIVGMVRTIFETHRAAMRKQGKASNLRYVGIERTVYACMWPGTSNFLEDTKHPTRAEYLQYGSSDFQLIELEKEELRTFDFFRTPAGNEKLRGYN